jgi:hypothetical protein
MDVGHEHVQTMSLASHHWFPHGAIMPAHAPDLSRLVQLGSRRRLSAVLGSIGAPRLRPPVAWPRQCLVRRRSPSNVLACAAHGALSSPAASLSR